MRKLFLATLLLGSALMVNAQSGTNSPYSQYGLGILSDQTSGFNRGMNGVGLGFHEHNQVNYLNPASYASIDSMTFILDAGISGQVTNFEENDVTKKTGVKKKNANNSNFEYVVAGFRLLPHVGMSFGIIPFTNVGYNYYQSKPKDIPSDMDFDYANTYSGEGGLHQAYIGAGWEPVKGLAVGANFSYLWGSIDRSVSNSYSNSYYKTLTRYYSMQVNSYKVDFGVQYTHQFSKKDWATVGVTFSPGHGLGASADMKIISNDTQNGVTDTTAYSIDKAYKLPTMIGAGVMWNHNNQWKVGFDYSLQKWGSLSYPRRYVNTKDKNDVLDVGGAYANRHKFNLGAQYCYGERSRAFFKRVQYRVGASYATPYYKMNGVDGPKEISVSAGFGIPIMNSYNNRSMLNISGQWVKSSAKDLIKENSFRINIGFTFNEDWFKKWKMD